MDHLSWLGPESMHWLHYVASYMVILDVYDNPLYLVHDHICYNIKQYRFSFVQAELGSNIFKYPKLGSLLGRPPSIGKAGGPIVLSSGSNISNTSPVDVSESTAIKRKRSSIAGEVLSSKKSRISGKCLMSVPACVIIMNFHIIMDICEPCRHGVQNSHE